MTPGTRLATIVVGGLLLASVCDRLVARALNIPTTAATGHKRFGRGDRPIHALVLGSSLTYSAIGWAEAAELLGVALESWPVPGSSPAEWEQVQKRSPHVTTTFVGVSVYDLNEESLCEFRANVVPFRQAASDLWTSKSDVPFARRMFSFYASTWLRTIYPTTGLSDRVIFGLRDEARGFWGGTRTNEDAGAGLTVAADMAPDERVSDWPQDRLLRRLATMRSSQGRPWFSGPKHLALIRLLQQAKRQGTVTVIVLPVSPLYCSRVIAAEDTNRFEASIVNAQQAVPGVMWVRYDGLAAVRSDECFSDLVHANLRGRSIITPEFLNRLASAPGGR
jgi:hypothetical protein